MGVSASIFDYGFQKVNISQQKIFLRCSPFFIHMDDAWLDHLVGCFIPRVVKPDTIIPYSEKQILLVGKGEVRVSILLPDFKGKHEGKLFLCIKRAGDILNPAATMKRATNAIFNREHSKMTSMLSELNMLAVGEVVLLYLKQDRLEALAAKNKDIRKQLEPLLGSHLIDHLRRFMFDKEMKNESQLQLFAEMCRYETFDAETVVFSEGDIGERFYILANGECEVQTKTKIVSPIACPVSSVLLFEGNAKKPLQTAQDVPVQTSAGLGRFPRLLKSKGSIAPYESQAENQQQTESDNPAYTVQIRTLKEGDFFGEAAFFMNIPRTASVVTLDKCLLISCEKTFFNNLMKVAPDLKSRIQLNMMERLLHRFMFLSNPYLKAFNEKQLLEVAKYCTLKEYLNGHVIYKKNETMEALYFVVYGQVSLNGSNMPQRSNSFSTSELRQPSLSKDFSSPVLNPKLQKHTSMVFSKQAVSIHPHPQKTIIAKTGDYFGQESLSKGSTNTTAHALGRCVLLCLDGNAHKVLESHSAIGRWNILAKRDKCRLRDVLRYFDAAEALRRFLEKELSVENLRFVRAVQKWKEVSEKNLRAAAEEIIDEYIKAGSHSQVNISNKLRNCVLEEFQNTEITQDFFDEAFKEVYLLLERDSFKRFIKSPFFKDLLHKMGTSMDINAVDSESVQKLKQRLGLHRSTQKALAKWKKFS